MVAFADDFSAVGKLKSLLQWWTTLLQVGPKFGYFREPQNRGLSQSLKHIQFEKIFSKIPK